MSLLSMPVCRSWQREQWAAWQKAEKIHFEKCNSRERKPPHYDAWDGRFNEYLDQREAALTWTEPSEIMLRVCVPSADSTEDTLAEIAVERLHRGNPKTFRAIIEAVCASNALHRDAYYWALERGEPENKMFAHKFNDLLQEEDTPCFSRLWQPSHSCLWENDNSFSRRMIATRKPSTVRVLPTQPPSFDLLKSPPPEGNAPVAEWSAWHKKNSMGSAKFWLQKNQAVCYRCPPVVSLQLQGVTHSVTVNAIADDALYVAVAAFAAAAVGEGVTSTAPSELLVKNSEGILDQQTTTARSLFYGARSTPMTLQVVHRDKAQAEAALEAKHGLVPEGYQSFRGLGYLVEDTEAPWLISNAHGLTSYNAVAGGALGVYEGTDYGVRENGVPAYDPIAKWWEMCALLKKDISSVARKPKGGWSRESAERAIDRFTGILLVTLINDEWRSDARGKIMGWDPECRKESILIMKRMDEAAAKLITAANAVLSEENQPSEPNGMLGLSRTLAQTKRLLPKLQEEYNGYSTPGYSHHQGYVSFSKAIPLLS